MPTQKTNEQEDWEKELRLKIWNVYATVFQISGYDDNQLKEKEDVIINHIQSLLLKRDKEWMEKIKHIRQNVVNASFMAHSKDETNYIKIVEFIDGLIK